jgi:hypothetical protein
MKRPVLVTVIGVLAVLGGVAQVVFGALLFGLRNDATFLADANIESNQVTPLAIALIVIGALTVVFAVGLLKGSRLSRNLVGVMEVLQIAGAVYALVALDAARRPSAIGSIVGALVVLYFLFGTEKAKAFFASA